MPINGRRPGLGRYLFGVLSLYHETKVPNPGVVYFSYTYTTSNETNFENLPET